MDVAGYQVQIAQLPKKSWRDVGHLKAGAAPDGSKGRVGAAKRKVRVARLQPGQSYVTRVRAQNGYGWGDWSEDSAAMQTGAASDGGGDDSRSRHGREDGKG